MAEEGGAQKASSSTPVFYASPDAAVAAACHDAT
jgi:hypothetical protein